MNVNEIRKYNKIYEEEQAIKKELEEKILKNIQSMIENDLITYLKNETNGFFAKIKERALKGEQSMQQNFYVYIDRIELEDLKINYSISNKSFESNTYNIINFIIEILRKYFEENGFKFTEGQSLEDKNNNNEKYKVKIMYIDWK